MSKEPLDIITFSWGTKYGTEYIERLKAGLMRHVKQEFRFGVFAPEAEDDHLTKIPGCFCRLRAFDPDWQARNGLTGRIVCVDLDAVVTGRLDPLFDRDDGFTILQGVNAVNPCRFNGSIWMLRAGYRPDVWKDFSLDAAGKIPFYSFPDDQGWFEHKMPDAGAWGPADGVYGFAKPGWPKGEGLPDNARLVAFFGSRDPSKFTHLDWIKQNWTV